MFESLKDQAALPVEMSTGHEFGAQGTKPGLLYVTPCLL